MRDIKHIIFETEEEFLHHAWEAERYGHYWKYRGTPYEIYQQLNTDFGGYGITDKWLGIAHSNDEPITYDDFFKMFANNEIRFYEPDTETVESYYDDVKDLFNVISVMVHKYGNTFNQHFYVLEDYS